MDENIYYHIHREINYNEDFKWKVGSIIEIGDDYNFFYKSSINFEAKYKEYKGKNDVPWNNVYEFILSNQMLNFHSIMDLLNNAKNIISEYQILLREIVYEKVRIKYKNNAPSRTRCIWLCKKEQLEFWEKQLNLQNYKIFKVKVINQPFKTSNDFLPAPSDSYLKMKEMAKEYWLYNKIDEMKSDEYLYVGKIEILEEIKFKRK